MRAFIQQCLVLSFFTQISFGQTSVADSFKKVYENSKSDTARLAILVELRGKLTIRDEQVENLNKQLLLSIKFQKFEMTADILGNLGWYKYVSEEFTSADSFYRKSISICQKYGYPRIEGSDYTRLMLLYWWQGKTKEGVGYFEKAETILKKINAYKELSNLYLSASELYKNINLFDQSLLYAGKSFDFANKSRDTVSIIQCAAFLGDAYTNLGEEKKALSTLNYALLLSKQKPNEHIQGDINYFFCKYYLGKKDYSKAIDYCNNALALFSKLHEKDRVLTMLDMLGDLYFFNKDFVNAKKIFVQIKQNSSDIDNMSNRYLYKKLANIDLVNKDIDTWKKDIAIADSLEELYTSVEVKKAVLDINTKYQTSLKEKKIILLQQQKSAQRILIICLLTGLIGLSAISFFAYRFISQKKLIAEQENIRLQQEKQLLAVSSILEGQETERTRMAKDLHDGLGGMLSGIKLNLSSMKGNMIIQEKDAQLFTRSIDQLDNAISEMRRVAHNMMPEALLKFGLGEAIQDYCDGINESNTVKMKYTQLGSHDPLEKSLEVILYRIIQELSNNAIRHAMAKNIFIQLTKHERGITLTVEDDGRGFDTSSLSNIKGAGLQNVQSRVDYLKGTLNIESETGKGTSVNIDVPL